MKSLRNRRRVTGKKRTSLPQVISHPKCAVAPPDKHLERIQKSKPLRMMKKFAKVKEGDPREECYDSLFGCGPVADLLAINFVQRSHVTAEVRQAMKRVSVNDGVEIGLQTQPLGRVSGSCPELDIKALKAKSQVFQKIGVSSINALAFIDLPDASDLSGFVIEVQERSLLFGPGIRHDIDIAKRAARASQRTDSTLEWLDLNDKRGLKKAIKAVVSPPLVGDPASRAAARASGDDGWMKHASIRALVIMAILSMLPLKKALSSQGYARVIMDASLKAAESRAKQEAKGEIAPIHRDAMAHFWFRELRRLGLDEFTVPLIKLH